MTDLSNLSPTKVWSFFEKICSIPHPSHHLEKISAFIIQWAKSKDLAVELDESGNILIKKAATPGYENTPKVALQGHLDMVPQKNNDTAHDFVQDPIQAYVDNQWVTAKGTTLGADNGIGVSAALAVLDSDDIIHGPLEVLLTADEETGMFGAFALKSGWLQSDILLNMDSEEEGEVCIGCAGGIDASITLGIKRVPLNDKTQTYQLIFTGLNGGHSGAEIHLGRANALKVLGRFLSIVKEDIQLLEVSGGTLRNAIPREAKAILALTDQQYQTCQTALFDFISLLKIEQKNIDNNISASLTRTDNSLLAFSDMDKDRVIATIDAAPNGVDKMSQDFTNVVEASLNFGILSTTQNEVNLHFLLRSLVDSSKEAIVSKLKSLAYLSGANIKLSGEYSGWKPNPDSKVLALFTQCYQERYQKMPEVKVIHAGLECGIFAHPYPNMDMISFGPTIRHPHSPSEEIEIKTVSLFFDQLKDVLAAIAQEK